MRRSPTRSVSGLKAMLDRRIIDEFAPMVRELVRGPGITLEDVQTFLDELDRLRSAQRLIRRTARGQEP